MNCTKLCRIVGPIVAVLFAAAASAEPWSTQRSQGRVFKVDAATQTVTVFESDGTHAYRLATADRITRNGRPLALASLEEGTPVMVYWRGDDSGQALRRAVKIDVPTVPADAPRDLVDSLLELEPLPAH